MVEEDEEEVVDVDEVELPGKVAVVVSVFGIGVGVFVVDSLRLRHDLSGCFSLAVIGVVVINGDMCCCGSMGNDDLRCKLLDGLIEGAAVALEDGE